jgi:hypothetical protein
MATRKPGTVLAEKSLYEPTPREVAVVEKHVAELAVHGPRLKILKDGNTPKIENDHPNQELGWVLLKEELAMNDMEFLRGFIGELADACGHDEQKLNFMLSVIRDIKPKAQIEAMLAAQMAAVYSASMKVSQALIEAECVPHRDSAERALNKLTRTFVTQMEALKRYRTGGEQTVTVQHVNIGNDGQAIAGGTQARREAASDESSSSPAAAPSGSQVPAMEIGEAKRQLTLVKRSS